MPDVFAVPVFLIVFRETLETVIIVSVLLAFLKQTLDGPNRDVAVYKRLVKQVRHPTQTIRPRSWVCLLNYFGNRFGWVSVWVSSSALSLQAV